MFVPSICGLLYLRALVELRRVERDIAPRVDERVANGLDEAERLFRFLHRYHDVCGADISPGPDYIAQLELCRQLEKHHSAKRMRDEEAASGAARRRGDAAAKKPKKPRKPKK